MLPEGALAAAIEASRTCDLFFSIGTSSLVQPVASLPYEAIRRGVVTIEVNPEAPPLTEAVTYSLRGPAGQMLPALLQATFGGDSGRL
jgi:NAD-dependent deacetylase